ncbi:MAG TPA: DCC1-like thiol-disulfide oxidoreductase family protein [Terracidiphilus sp.]
MPHPILLYDGVCGLCNRLVQFILRRDSSGVFRFASLQSETATRILERHGVDAHNLDTVYVVVNYGQTDEEVLPRSDAVIFMLRHLGAAEPSTARPDQESGSTVARAPTAPPPGLKRWRFAAYLLQIVLRPIRDWGYRIVASNRYRIFGRYDTCPIPSDQTRTRFLDV